VKPACFELLDERMHGEQRAEQRQRQSASWVLVKSVMGRTLGECADAIHAARFVEGEGRALRMSEE